MKLKLLLLFLFLWGIVNAQISVYHPFPEDSALWIVNWTHQSNLPVQRDLYIMNGDTVINNTLYNKLYKEKNFYDPFTPNVIQPYTYLGALRQDSLNKKIYYKGISMASDTLLYNFDLHIGDTVRPSFMANYLYPKPTIVATIDSILINKRYYKKFNFNNSGLFYGHLIEGIGSDCGLFEIASHTEGGPSLACFKDHYISAFDMSYGPAHPMYDHCGYYYGKLLSTEEENKNSLYFSSLPNPSSGIFRIQSSEKLFLIEIINIVGEKVYSSSVNSPDAEIDLSSQSNGLYFLQVRTSDGLANKKIIIQK